MQMINYFSANIKKKGVKFHTFIFLRVINKL